jgi:hypothetical protein
MKGKGSPMMLFLFLYLILWMSGGQTERWEADLYDEGSSAMSNPDGISLVYVHLGNDLPEYIATSIHQARLFNPDIQIYLLASNDAYRRKCVTTNDNITLFNDNDATFVDVNSLEISENRLAYEASSRLDRNFRDGYWYHASARFFHLAELMTQYNLRHVVHMESDVMLYTQLSRHFNVLTTQYPGLGVTFDNDRRVVPGFVWISQVEFLNRYLQFVISNKEQLGLNDMASLAAYRDFAGRDSGLILPLPIASTHYTVTHAPLRSLNGVEVGSVPEEFSNNFESFGQSIFDACALGQYLGGVDKRNTAENIHLVGFINEGSILDARYWRFSWVRDAQGRLVPLARDENGQNIFINNLHVHSKDLMKFFSLRESVGKVYNYNARFRLQNLLKDSLPSKVSSPSLSSSSSSSSATPQSSATSASPIITSSQIISGAGPEMKMKMTMKMGMRYETLVKGALENADKYQSKITNDILELEGMSGSKTRHFLNNLLNTNDVRYLEIGTWKGSTVCSAMYGNSASVVCIDNWSEFEGPKAEFLLNFEKYKGNNYATFIESDSFKVDVSRLPKFNIYFYDGDHALVSHYKALSYYYNCLDDVFIFIVDAWNWADVQLGTKTAITELDLSVLYEKEIVVTTDHPYGFDKSTWWNGIYIAILKKNYSNDFFPEIRM